MYVHVHLKLHGPGFSVINPIQATIVSMMLWLMSMPCQIMALLPVERKSSLMVDADVVGGKDNVSSWRRIFEKLIVTQLVKKFSTFCGA
jgi:hypothetical protein